MTSTEICLLIAIIAYLGLTVLIGVYYSKKGSASSTANFYLGGRGLHPVVTAMSAEASDMSSYLLMGLPGLAYLCGVAEVGWTVLGLAVGTYLNFLLVAKRLRIYSEKIGATTIPDFFAKRYEDKKHTLSFIAAMAILIFFIPYTASGFKAVGTLFNSLFGWDYHMAMIVGAIVIIGYTVLGGFLAVSTTDLIQSVVMSIALLIIILFGIGQAGGLSSVIENAGNLPGYLDLTKGYDISTNSAGSFGILSIVSTLAWGLGYFGMPHILLRFMAIRNPKEIKVSRRIAAVWVVLSMAIAVFIGIIGLSISIVGKVPTFQTSAESETIIVSIAHLMSQNGIFFAIVAGVIMSGILAATMSTADSQLLAAASSMSEDILHEFFGINLDQKKSMLVARLTVIAIAIIGILLAWNPQSSVFRVVSFAWAGFGAAFGPVMLLALFWKRSNRQGAVAGMITGVLMVFVWKYLIAPMGGVFSIYELLPAFIIALLVNVTVSLLTKVPSESINSIYDEVKSECEKKDEDNIEKKAA
ncbi:sodium/proline symporter [Acetitomaculum ruminis DSM 5522]|uniref:Sodium/proline symporter n=1 Tax=Acetitomaculum ruminis DSM 5522 TaxID=1120918 RepID=A0A1I0WPD5_9FIRM|nr:sodium/proline symporter [Acetitomaculum ruminis]SFA89836.1 sodium/proline symporter [Acetitomaculum ruminis DSM 5522]